ncbi:homocysteine S-methyltransferase family protein [Altererythrobacter sp. MF3-039]|uniref:homocysteine S-methyltransferase family protein n=1 Tax=Altererythrobacter sp. MF3-039 TaxID=3252901 RepID=UPI00390CCADF
MSTFDKLMHASRPFLTDGGFETWLFFQQGFEAPEFAAITLIDDLEAEAAMRRYFGEFLKLAEQAVSGFVLDTNSWRGCVSWAEKLGFGEQELLDLSRKSVRFAQSIRDEWQGRVDPILVNGVIGPCGDGYSPSDLPTAVEAQALHAPQIGVLAQAGVDMFSAITMTNVPEAVGIARAANETGKPVVISFTLETDGTLPTGVTLRDAITAVDRETGSAPAYYMINCAHPDHFRDVVANGEPWTDRIGAVRANASRLSHAELDNAEVLDEGDPGEFGELHVELARRLTKLRVVGGCCGTDMRHVSCVSRHLHAAIAA